MIILVSTQRRLRGHSGATQEPLSHLEVRWSFSSGLKLSKVLFIAYNNYRSSDCAGNNNVLHRIEERFTHILTMKRKCELMNLAHGKHCQSLTKWYSWQNNGCSFKNEDFIWLIHFCNVINITKCTHDSNNRLCGFDNAQSFKSLSSVGNPSWFSWVFQKSN